MAKRFLFCILLFPVDRTDITILLETTEALQVIRDIGQTVHKRILVVLSHIATHPLTGCDSVCCFLGNVNSDFEVIVAKSTECIYICREMTPRTIMLNKM